MENFEQIPEKPKSVEEAVSAFLDENTEFAIAFLRENKGKITEFCLQVRDAYGEKDTTTPFVKLSALIEELLDE